MTIEFSSIRTSATEIPSQSELTQILSQESLRQRPKEKLMIEYGDYSSIVNLCNFYNIKTDIFQVLKSTAIYLDESDNLKKELIQKIVNTDVKDLPIEAFNQMYDYLSEEDTLIDSVKFDTIFVFGSASTVRTTKAIELYKSGYSKLITISGHKPFYKNRADTEAEFLANYTIENGVAKNDITIENRGISLPDNVKRTLDIWEESNYNPKSIIIVTSPFVMRRAYIEWQKYPDFDLRVIRQCCSVSDTFSRENWYKSEVGLNIILNEFIKIRGEYLVDLALAGVI